MMPFQRNAPFESMVARPFYGRDGMDTALPPEKWPRLRASMTERHQGSKVELRRNHLTSGGPR
jgi:hypothetical protein